jgi:hypothetical protein
MQCILLSIRSFILITIFSVNVMCHMCDTNHQHFFLSRLSLQRSLIHCLRVDVYPMFNKLNNSLRIGFPFHILPRCRQQNNPLYNSLIGI